MTGFESSFPLLDLAWILRGLGAKQVLVKHLAPNDNGKNQVYLAGDVSSLGLLPMGEIEYRAGSSTKPSASKRGPIFRAALDLWWIGPDFSIAPAPHAKLILYPQYSEVRLSGFVKDSAFAPSDLFDPSRRGRDHGRVLLLAPLLDGRVVAVAFPPESAEANALRAVEGERYGVLRRFQLIHAESGRSSEELLLTQLARIHESGWLDPVYLLPDSSYRPCRGPNCGGVTLESHLGIRANGSSEPDFHGWEVKQHGVVSLDRPRGSRITLMTPEPSGGAYAELGAEYFIRTWGYPARSGQLDRLNFGGVYRSEGEVNGLTGLRLVLEGFDRDTGDFSGDGVVALLDRSDRLAASWSFAKLLNHWRKKHERAAFVPSMIQKIPSIKYRYGHMVGLAEGAKFSLLLQAFCHGVVYYDPGMKIEGASTSGSRVKCRSQFRIGSQHISTVYERFRAVDVRQYV